jgi:hypothetical protein
MQSQKPVTYMPRSRAYYEAQGFEQPYRYAQHDDAPFTPLPRPLTQCTLGIVTTASIYHRDTLEPRKVNSGSTSESPSHLYTDDLSWDKQATHTEDVNSFCPISPLQELAAAGRIGALAPRFHCAPTDYSQRTTCEQEAPEILNRLQDDAADIALLVPL